MTQIQIRIYDSLYIKVKNESLIWASKDIDIRFI